MSEVWGWYHCTFQHSTGCGLTLRSMSTGSTHLSIVLDTTCSNSTRTKLPRAKYRISPWQLTNAHPPIRLTVHQARISRDRFADSGRPLASAGGQTCQMFSSGHTLGKPADSRHQGDGVCAVDGGNKMVVALACTKLTSRH